MARVYILVSNLFAHLKFHIEMFITESLFQMLDRTKSGLMISVRKKAE